MGYDAGEAIRGLEVCLGGRPRAEGASSGYFFLTEEHRPCA
jgi:hypothetical protein